MASVFGYTISVFGCAILGFGRAIPDFGRVILGLRIMISYSSFINFGLVFVNTKSVFVNSKPKFIDTVLEFVCPALKSAPCQLDIALLTVEFICLPPKDGKIIYRSPFAVCGCAVGAFGSKQLAPVSQKCAVSSSKSRVSI